MAESCSFQSQDCIAQLYSRGYWLDPTSNSPVSLPGVQSLWFCDPELCGLQVQEIKERLYSLGQDLAVGDSKDGLKELVKVRLEDALWVRETKWRVIMICFSLSCNCWTWSSSLLTLFNASEWYSQPIKLILRSHSETHVIWKIQLWNPFWSHSKILFWNPFWEPF